MHSLILVALGLLLLIVQAALSIWLPLDDYIPNLVLPIIVYLGMSSQISLAKGSALSFALGYLVDSACALPLGLQTLTTVSSFIIARNAGARLLPKGPLSLGLLTFLTALLSGAILLSLRAIFEPPPPFDSAATGNSLGTLLRHAFATALCGPLVVRALRPLERLQLRPGEAHPQLGA